MKTRISTISNIDLNQKSHNKFKSQSKSHKLNKSSEDTINYRCKMENSIAPNQSLNFEYYQNENDNSWINIKQSSISDHNEFSLIYNSEEKIKEDERICKDNLNWVVDSLFRDSEEKQRKRNIKSRFGRNQDRGNK